MVVALMSTMHYHREARFPMALDGARERSNVSLGKEHIQ